MFLMWLGEQITARGIGNGISLIIFVGIMAEVPAALATFFQQGRTGVISTPVILFVIVMLIAIIAFVVFMERALRKIRIQYPRRQVGMKVYDGESSHLPVKVNPAGVIPAIFACVASAAADHHLDLLGQRDRAGHVAGPGLLRARPAAVPAVLRGDDRLLHATSTRTNVSFKTDDVAENLKNQGGFIPGIRPGKRTQDYLDYVVNRILVLGSGYLALVCLMPEILRDQFSIPVYLGRHLGPDRRVGDDGHDQPGPEPLAGAPIRRSD